MTDDRAALRALLEAVEAWERAWLRRHAAIDRINAVVSSCGFGDAGADDEMYHAVENAWGVEDMAGESLHLALTTYRAATTTPDAAGE